MRIRHFLLALLLLGALPARGQTAADATKAPTGATKASVDASKAPVEITVGEGGTQRFENGLAIAQKDVTVHHGGASLYADYVQYDPKSHEMMLVGNVRVFDEGHLMVGDRGVYNVETKMLRVQNGRSEMFPFFCQAESLNSVDGGKKAFEATHLTLATTDSSKPEVHLNARKALIYPKDHVVLSDVTIYIGETPVLWLPYVYQSLKGNEGFRFLPGYSSGWGDYLLLHDGFPIGWGLHGTAHLDYRTLRGAAAGMDVDGSYGHNNESWIHFKSYYADDLKPNTNTTAALRLPVGSARYRFVLQDRTYINPDLYATCNINKLSDYVFLHDFNPEEYSGDPQPDSVASLTKWSENYTVTTVARLQLNNFFDTTERRPDLSLDVKRQPLFGLPIYYESESSAASLARDFGSSLTVTTSTTNRAGKLRTVHETLTPAMLDYSANRFDTFHQLTMPETLGGWLTLVPRVGVRETYYSQGGQTNGLLIGATNVTGENTNTDLLQTGSGNGLFRSVFDTGLDMSLKASREWDNVQFRSWGLDGIRHVFQPFVDLSYVKASCPPSSILQFDRLNPSTELPSIDFPQFTTIDTISSWSIAQLGMRNRLETRRDGATVEWLSVETYFDYNLQKPDFPGFPTDQTFSNLFNKVTWTPLPWLMLRCDSQIPVFDPSFTEVDSFASVRFSRDFSTSISHRYLYGNKFFAPGNEISAQAYYRINDNWGISAVEYCELMDKPSQNVVPGLIHQEYKIYRDLSGWIASLGLVLSRNVNAATNTDITNTTVVLSFTLRDLPSVTLPVSFNPSSLVGQ